MIRFEALPELSDQIASTRLNLDAGSFHTSQARLAVFERGHVTVITATEG